MWLQAVACGGHCWLSFLFLDIFLQPFFCYLFSFPLFFFFFSFCSPAMAVLLLTVGEEED
jgi:hypothetical protein